MTSAVALRPHRAGLLPRVLGLYIDAGAEKPLVMRDIRNPDLVQEVLHDLMEDLPPAIRARRMGPRAQETYGGNPSAVSDQSSLWNRG